MRSASDRVSPHVKRQTAAEIIPHQLNSHSYGEPCGQHIASREWVFRVFVCVCECVRAFFQEPSNNNNHNNNHLPSTFIKDTDYPPA